MAKSKKRICNVGDRISAPSDRWGTVTNNNYSSYRPYQIRWDNGQVMHYSEKDFTTCRLTIHPPLPTTEDIEEEDLAQFDQDELDFSREQNWKVGDRISIKGRWGKIVQDSYSKRWPYEIAWDAGGKTVHAGEEFDTCLPLLSETSAQVSVQVSHSPGSSLEDLPLLAYVNQTNGAEESSSSDTQVSQSTQISEAIGETEVMTLQPSLPRANHSVSKEKGLEPTTLEIVSQQSSQSSRKTSQNSLRSKMSEDSLPALGDQVTEKEPTSTIFAVTFAAWDTDLSEESSAQDILEPPSLGRGYFWLDSPGALSSRGRSPGQDKLQSSMKANGLINTGECLNPRSLEKAFDLPLDWTNPSECRPAAQLLAAEEKPLATALTPESQQSLLGESSTSTPSEKTEKELTPVDESAIGRHYWCDRKTVAVTVLTIEHLGATVQPWWTKENGKTVHSETFLVYLRELVELEEFSCPVPEVEERSPDQSDDSLEKPQTLTGKESGKPAEDWSKQVGKVDPYTQPNWNNDGSFTLYPKVEGERLKDEDSHWYWRWAYKNLVKGQWRSTTSPINKSSLQIARRLEAEKFVVWVSIQICKLKWLWTEERGCYLIGEVRPSACPRLCLISFKEKDFFLTGPAWGEATPIYRQRKREELIRAIAERKPFSYIKELLK